MRNLWLIDPLIHIKGEAIRIEINKDFLTSPGIYVVLEGEHFIPYMKEPIDYFEMQWSSLMIQRFVI